MAKGGKRDLAVIERDAKAWQLRADHMTYAEIARELGVSQGGAHLMVKRYAALIPVEMVSEVKDAILHELNWMSRELKRVARADHWQFAQNGKVVERDGEPLVDEGPLIMAITTSLRVIDTKAKLLGLYAPTQGRLDVITHDAFMAAVTQINTEIAELEARKALEAVTVDAED